MPYVMKSRLNVRSFIVLALLLLQGCAVLPNYVGPVLEHDSHVTQHFGSDQTNYGSEVLGVTALWVSADGGPFAEVTDGVTLGPRWKNDAGSGYGEVFGPRETFEAQVGWLFKLH